LDYDFRAKERAKDIRKGDPLFAITRHHVPRANLVQVEHGSPLELYIRQVLHHGTTY
jgi:hypothetical protein